MRCGRNLQDCSAVAIGQAEAEIGGPAGGVHLQLLAQAPYQVKDAAAGLIEGAHRHDQRIDDDVGMGNAKIGSAVDDLLRHLETHVGVLGDAGLVIGDGDDSRTVLLHQRQHDFQALFLAGHRIQQGLALVDLEAFFQRRDDG